MEGLLGAHNGLKFHIATTPKSAHYRTHAPKQTLLFNLDGLTDPRRCVASHLDCGLEAHPSSGSRSGYCKCWAATAAGTGRANR